MIIFHVLLRIIACYRPQGQTQKGVWLGSWKHGPWNTRSVWGMNTAYALADCSQDYPRREWPGVKTRRSELCQCSVLGKIDQRLGQRQFCSLQLEIKAGLRMDSTPQSNRGCISLDPLHQILCSVFILVAGSRTFRATRSLGWENPLEEGMATPSSFLPGESHGQSRMVNCSL